MRSVNDKLISTQLHDMRLLPAHLRQAVCILFPQKCVPRSGGHLRNWLLDMCHSPKFWCLYCRACLRGPWKRRYQRWLHYVRVCSFTSSDLSTLTPPISILASSLPLERRPIFVASYSSMYGVAAVAAPLIGGAFTTKATWRWCFYLNLPFGVITILAVTLFFHPPGKPLAVSSTTWREKVSQMDLLGTAVLIPGVVCLLIVLQWGGTVYAWSDGKVIGVLVVFAVAMLAFICIQSWKQDKGTIPPRIIRHRSVACSTCYVFLAGGAVNIFEYYVCTRGWTSGSQPPPPPKAPPCPPIPTADLLIYPCNRPAPCLVSSNSRRNCPRLRSPYTCFDAGDRSVLFRSRLRGVSDRVLHPIYDYWGCLSRYWLRLDDYL